MDSEEQWKKLTGLLDGYQISDQGRLRLKSGRISIRKASPYTGYVVFSMGKSSFSVHKLVAEAFVPNINQDIYVRHKNGNFSDNRAVNLEWTSTRFNPKPPKYKVDSTEDEEWGVYNYNNVVVRVSSIGRVITTDGRIVSGFMKNSYLVVQIDDHRFSLHRMVCMVFKPIPDYEKYTVHHIDGNRFNNRIENLEWRKNGEGRNHFCYGKTIQMTDNLNKVNTFKSMHEASRITGIPRSTILRYIRSGDMYDGKFVFSEVDS